MAILGKTGEKWFRFFTFANSNDMNKAVRNIFIRYGTATAGMLFVAMGVALSIISNLGTSPLSALGYVLSPIGGGRISVGNWTIIVNLTYIFIQLAVFKTKFKAEYLLQIPATVIFGYMIDFSLWVFSWLHPAGFIIKLTLLIISCFVTALGVSIEVVSHAWMLSAEMTVSSITKTYHKKFDEVKVVMDLCHVVISSAIAYLVYRNPFGFGQYDGLAAVLSGQTEGVVIGLGTLLMAILAGGFMKITDPVVDKAIGAIIDKTVFDVPE